MAKSKLAWRYADFLRNIHRGSPTLSGSPCGFWLVQKAPRLREAVGAPCVRGAFRGKDAPLEEMRGMHSG